jgi:hypothetical protein
VLNWRLLAERRIMDAMERGEFEDLPGKGQPLQWRENSFVPPEWRLAFDLLDRAGLAPEWIMRSAEIRASMADLARQRHREALWMEERRTAMAAMSPEERTTEQERLRTVRARTWDRLRVTIEKLNRKIADFNLIVPIVRLQFRPVDPAEEQAALQDAWGSRTKEETR